jgi:hypothetical protein
MWYSLYLYDTLDQWDQWVEICRLDIHVQWILLARLPQNACNHLRILGLGRLQESRLPATNTSWLRSIFAILRVEVHWGGLMVRWISPNIYMKHNEEVASTLRSKGFLWFGSKVDPRVTPGPCMDLREQTWQYAFLTQSHLRNTLRAHHNDVDLNLGFLYVTTR